MDAKQAREIAAKKTVELEQLKKEKAERVSQEAKEMLAALKKKHAPLIAERVKTVAAQGDYGCGYHVGTAKSWQEAAILAFRQLLEDLKHSLESMGYRVTTNIKPGQERDYDDSIEDVVNYSIDIGW